MKRQSVMCCVMTLAIVFVMMFVQSSCMTRKSLTERVMVHDTLREYHTDTVRLATHRSHTDTVKESRVQVITLRQDSARTDTVRVETMCEKWHFVYVTDTVNTFHHLADSLQAVNKREEMKKVSIPNRHARGVWCMVTLLVTAVVIFFIIVIWKKRI